MLKTSITTQVGGESHKFSEVLSENFQCPECGHKFNQSIAGMKDEAVVICPTCIHGFSVKSIGAVDAAKSLDDLDRAWDNLIK